MRVAVISDIHANLHALEAALAKIEAASVDTIWCLGDTVGYGPRPNECCAIVERRTTLCLAGNHDLVVRGDIDLDDFSGDAGEAARWTRSELTTDSAAFLARLEPQAQREGVELFHGGPRDPVWDYVLSEKVAWLSLRSTEAPLLLVGHSHVALGLHDEGDSGVSGGLAPADTELGLSGRWLLNPGSIGQPRDGDPRAAWLLLDLAKQRATFERTPYDVAATQREMKAAGLPKPLVRRLERGQ